MSDQNNALTVLNNQPSTEMSFGFSSAAFTGFAIRPANLTIVQPMTAAKNPNAKFGCFYDAKTGTNHDSMVVVMAALPRTNRVLMPKGQFGAKPICKSRGCEPGSNVMIPVTDDPNLMPQAPRCGYYKMGKYGRPIFVAECDKANWALWHKNGKQPQFKPECREQDDFLFVEKETLLPYRLNIHGTSLGVFRQKMEGVARYAQSMIAKGFKPEPYWFEMTLSLKKESNSQGNFALLEINNINPLSESEREIFKEQFLKFVGVNLEDEDEGETKSVDAEIEGQAPVTEY